MIEKLKEIYGWFGQFWKHTITLFLNQTLDFGSLKVLIHIPFHLLISAGVAFLSFAIWNDAVIGFYSGVVSGISIELALFFWFDFWKGKFTGIIQSLFDILTYTVGAATVLLMLI